MGHPHLAWRIRKVVPGPPAVDFKSVGDAGLLEDSFEDLFGMVSGEEGEAVVAAEGNEVELAGLVVALQALGHVWRVRAVDLAVDDPLMA